MLKYYLCLKENQDELVLINCFSLYRLFQCVVNDGIIRPSAGKWQTGNLYSSKFNYSLPESTSGTEGVD